MGLGTQHWKTSSATLTKNKKDRHQKKKKKATPKNSSTALYILNC